MAVCCMAHLLVLLDLRQLPLGLLDLVLQNQNKRTRLLINTPAATVSTPSSVSQA